MKLGTVLTACDLKQLYYDFIPNFVKAWKFLFPDTDICIVLIADSLPIYLNEYKDYIKIFHPIQGIHTAFQAQCIRLLYPREIIRDEGVLITDMDMIPMNRSYYIDAISGYDNTNFIAYYDFRLPNEMAMCYNIATPSVWKDMFGTDSIENILNLWYDGIIYDGQHGGKGWATDQIILAQKFNCWKGPKIILNGNITRLDRSDSYIFGNVNLLIENIRNNFYSDYHCLRPNSEFSQINNLIVNCLTSPSADLDRNSNAIPSTDKQLVHRLELTGKDFQARERTCQRHRQRQLQRRLK